MDTQIKQSESEILDQASDHEFKFRFLEVGDYSRGFLETLGQMTVIGQISQQDFERQFSEMFTERSDVYKVVVLTTCEMDTEVVIGSGSLICERKFIRQLGPAGPLEDIVVKDSYRGKHLGQRLMEVLKKLAVANNCYKTILDCAPDKVGFYEKSDFFVKGTQMAWYREGNHVPSKL